VTVERGADVIVAIDGLPVRSADDVVRVVSTRLRPRTTATFTVARADRRVDLPVSLVERPCGV
jgi:S1-C subfamily serine protease